MKESFLHFIWRSRLFNTLDLHTTTGDRLIIRNVGLQNANSGPDFLNAQIQIGDQVWAGNIEIHKKSSQWYEHGHHYDMRYGTVVLHVVWEHDLAVYNKSNAAVPTLVLKNLVDPSVLKKYEKLQFTIGSNLACSKDIAHVPTLKFNHWMDRLFVERLEMKVVKMEAVFEHFKKDWNALLYSSLMESFGLKVNSDPFINLARLLPFSVVRKHLYDQKSLEALFLGSAGLLEDSQGPYKSALYAHYNYLRSKYKLSQLNSGQVQFFRLRPLNFPTIRLAQLAALYHQNDHLFANLLACDSVNDIYTVFQAKAGRFWDTHYTFGAESAKKEKWLSKAFVDLLIINVVVPLKYFYANYHGTNNCDELMKLMESLKPEKNAIISEFSKCGIKANNAFVTQSLLQLKKHYCDKSRCLNCGIGIALISD